MSFLNQSSQCNNGNDIYSSNLKEISGIGVLEFDDIFEDLDLQTFKKPQNRFEKNNSLYISSKKKPDAETLQLNQEKARTETIQNQSSFNNLNENYLSCNNVKRYASLYNKAGNLTKGPPIEEPILNPFQKKGNNLCQETNNPKLNVENNNTNNNLEKKVQSNNKSLIKCDEEKNNDKEPYFNNNPLKFEDNLNISNNFYPPQNFTDESQNIVNIIKHLSMADYPSQKAILKSEYGSPMFQNSHNYSINFAIIEDFQKFIDNSKPNDVIQLPQIRLSLPSLRINKPLTFQGTAQTILEITEGPIFIDLSDSQTNVACKVVFSECNILFDIDKFRQSLSKNQTEIHNNFTDSNKSSLNHNSTPNTHRENLFCLFRIKGSSHIELRDCVVKNVAKHLISPFSEDLMKGHKDIQEICFILKGDAYSQERKHQSSVSLKSCKFTNFFSVVECHTFTTLSIEKCLFSEIKGYCINASNLFSAKIKENCFERIEKSCINLRFSHEFKKSFKRNIFIKDNEFKNSFSYGISAFSESPQIHQNITFSILKNIFINLTKDIICLKNLSFNLIEIKNNELSNSKQNGLKLENCIDTQTFSQIEVAHNKIFNCGGFGLSISDSPSKHSHNEIFQNDKGGINLFGHDNLKPDEIKHFNENPIRIIMNESNIFDNNGPGIGITGLMKGPVLIIKCYIYENLDGIFVRENEEVKRNLKLKDFLNKKGGGYRIGQISLEKSSIFQNKRSGVFLDCLISTAYFSETLIKDNQNQAVILTCQKDKNLIEFKDKNTGKLRDFVYGFIGGPWGELYEEKNDACKGGKCQVF